MAGVRDALPFWEAALQRAGTAAKAIMVASIARYGRLFDACDVLPDRREDVPVGRVSWGGIPNVRISACF